MTNSDRLFYILATAAAIFLMLVLDSPAFGADSVIFNHTSTHLSYDEWCDDAGCHELNETNGGFGLEHQVSPSKYMLAGAYTSSFNDPAVYIAVSKMYWRPASFVAVGLTWTAVVSEAYNQRIGVWKYTPLPITTPTIRLNYRGAGVNIMYKPKLTESDGAIVAVQWLVRWR